MSIKKLLGLDEFEHVSDEEILEKIAEAKAKGETHIELKDEKGNIVKIEIPSGISLDKTDDR